MPDVIVVGAGPAGLGAALAAARAGASVVVVDAAGQVGGLCVTRRGPGVAYDLGGHIPFVRNEQRLHWLRALLGDSLQWVPRPVSCVRDGAIHPGRYLDQRPERRGRPLAADGTARGELGGAHGAAFVDRVLRPYLEKIDGVPLERIPADRVRRLRDDQAAPEGFHYPVQGIGQLMDAMADAADVAGARIRLRTRTTAITTHGGRVTGVVTDGPQGRKIISGASLVVAMPAAAAARMVVPHPPPAVVGPVRMRAVCLVYVETTPASPLDQAWVQVDDPGVPFARAFLPGRWSESLASGNRTVFGMECYCHPEIDDPIWGLSDAALTAECARALTGTLGWVDTHAHIEPLEVVRLPRAYPVPDVQQVAQVQAAPLWLSGIGGVHLAPGAAVIEAIENGEAAAAEALAGLAI